ncbi:cell division protein FtsA [Desulfobacterota bacterium AH_259_B03_O07]|nr:cell division protein FtsA [Desulfobacterota bacterium AH_259_B03_O07]
MGKESNLVIGLDIGTTKVCAIVGEVNSHDEIDIIGIGTHPSYGLKRGVVVNIDDTVQSIKNAVEEAEHMAGCEIRTVFAGIAGGHVKGISGHGMITLRNREVTERDVERVIESANALLIPADREIIHVIPQEFIVDGQAGIKDPIGICGIKLETKVHIVTGQITAAQNLVKCIHRAGMDVADIALEQLASSQAVLTSDEKEIGVVLIDCGGGTTDIAIFVGGSIRYTENLTLGGDHIDRDIALGLSTPLAEAKKIKEKYGVAITDIVSPNETIEVPSVGGRRPRKIPKADLAMIMEPRVEEIFSLVRSEIIKSGFRDLIPAGAVITGGSVIIDGTDELAEKILGMPVRRGIPTELGGLNDIVANPIYSTGVGLVLYGTNYNGESKLRIRDENIFKKVYDSMKNWFQEFF